MRTLRSWVLVAAAGALFAAGATAQDKKRTDDPDKGKKVEKKEGKDKAKPTPPRMRYEHTSLQGNKGTFTLDRAGGTAEYTFNGARHKDKLVFVRAAQVPDPRDQRTYDGWVYQVERDGKKYPLWFLFGSTAIKNQQNETVYPMYYTTQPPRPDGKQPWDRIYTQMGTKATKLDAK